MMLGHSGRVLNWCPQIENCPISIFLLHSIQADDPGQIVNYRASWRRRKARRDDYYHRPNHVSRQDEFRALNGLLVWPGLAVK